MKTDKSIMTFNINAMDPEEFPGYVQTIYNMTRMSDYVTTGEYFMNINEEDLEELLQSIDRITVTEGFEDPISFKNVTVLTILLRIAEGSPDITPEDLHKSMGTVCTYAALEGLARQGQVEIFHQNMCVAGDQLADSKIIAKRIKDD
jgi:hypothetical protein